MKHPSLSSSSSRSPLSRLTRLSSLVLALGVAACGAESERAGTSPRGPSSQTPPSPEPSIGQPSAERAIAEADIIQLDGGRLYAMSRSGAVSVVDVSQRGRLALLGQTQVQGEPFEMYRRGDLLVAISNDAGTSASVIVLDVAQPESIHTVATLPVPGEIADSRVVGDVLYLATYENAQCFKCGKTQRTLVTTFDITHPTAMSQVDQVVFESNAPDGFNAPWGSNWKRSIFVTPERLYVGGHADIDPKALNSSTHLEGIIDVLDITDPHGHLGRGARIEVAGALLSRWQIDERHGILRVITQRGAGRTGNGIGEPNVDVFRVDGAQSFTPLGHTTIKMPRQEGLRTVRFDEDRAYAITYNQTDPLFTIDLRDPTAPKQRGELHMPGFMFHLEPHGDRLLGLGVDRADPGGSLNVSLFDVADMDAPRMMKRVSFGAARISEDYLILNYEVPEDQDRIQKAFRVLDGGLVVVPFSTGKGCSGDGGGAVQLVDWSNDTLTKGALLTMRGNARRAFKIEDEMIAVSDSNVRSFALGRAGLAAAAQTADLVIGECVARTMPGGYGGGQLGGQSPSNRREERGDYDIHDDHGYGHCALVGGGAGLGASSGAGGAAGAMLALVVATVAVRRRRA